MNPNTFLYAVLGVAIGILAVWILSSRYRSNARVESSNIVELARKEASIDRRHQIAEASLEIKQERQELAQDIKRLRAELSERERDLSAKELTANAMACDLENRLLKLSLQEEELSNREKLVLDTSSGYRTKLEEIAQLNPEDIRNRLEDEVRQECEDDLRDMRQRLFSQSDLEIQREAQRIILTAMQRIACTPDSSNAASTVVLPNDEMKGRIIGKEGRNIKAFEALTGVTLMIDEVPGSVLISCFDPVRREAARVALQLLVEDGRIHPASIEESIQRGQKEIDNLVFQYGEQAVQKLSLTGIPNEVLSLLGKLKFRYSFNQNTLDHSIECAYISSMLASELGLDPTLAKRAGLLHDIGKAVEHQYEGSHAMMAAKILRNYGENEAVVNAVEAHHKEVEPSSLYAPLLMIADSVSATRPGARVESLDAYAKRLVRLEAIAKDIEGVSEVFAIQAGREIRVMVEPEKVQEKDARLIALKIRNRIEEELQYPSTIKVTVIREQRFIETAT